LRRRLHRGESRLSAVRAADGTLPPARLAAPAVVERAAGYAAPRRACRLCNRGRCPSVLAVGGPAYRGDAREALNMPARAMLLHLACVLSGLGVALAGALLASTGQAA